MRKDTYLLGSRAHVMRTRRLRARLAYVMRVDNRARVTYAAVTPVVLKVFGERQQAAKITGIVKALRFCKLPATIAENVKA
jgi:hypothetical protein